MAAFTLIELTVVIALIGILSVMIIPEMRGTYEGALLRSTSRKLVNLCNLAYSESVSLQRVHRIHLDTKTGHFVLEKRAHQATENDGFVHTSDVPGGDGELDNRISIRFHRQAEEQSGSDTSEQAADLTSQASDAGSRIVLAFYPDGTADGGEILLRDRQGFGLMLRINPVTARVRVSELPRE